MPGDLFPDRPRGARSIGCMADLYALDLAFDLLDSTPDTVLAEVRRQLAPDTGLLCARGPAWRVRGVLVGEFAPTEHGGWALTARQEIHAEQLPDLEDFLLSWPPTSARRARSAASATTSTRPRTCWSCARAAWSSSPSTRARRPGGLRGPVQPTVPKVARPVGR